MRKFSLGLAFSLACSAVFAADAPAPAAAAPGIIPVETFFTYSKVSAAKISPDGKYLAMAIANDKTGLEKNIFVIISLADMKAQARIDMLGDESVADFWWANDERVLVSGETKTGSLDQPVGDGKLYAVNVDGTKKIQLLPTASNNRGNKQLEAAHTAGGGGTAVYFADLMWLDSEKDPKHVIFQGYEYEGSYVQQPKAYQLDIYTGQIRRVATGGERFGDLVADNDGKVRITQGSDDHGHAQMFYRASEDDVNWKDLTSLIRNEDPAQVETQVLAFAPDNRQFYMLARTKDSTLGLYEVDPDTLAMKPLFEDPEFDVNGIVWSFWDEKTGVHPVAVETMPGLPKIAVVDPDAPEVDYIAQLYDAFPGQHVRITSYTRDHKTMIVYTHSDTNPGDFYLYDSKSSQVRQLFAVKPEIDPAKMASMMPISFTARDGVVLHGYLTLPNGSSGKNLPLIVNPHGGPHTIRDHWSFEPEEQLFANRGYAVLQLNYRGSGGYGLKFQQLGYRHWSSTMQDDLADGVNWAVKQGYADANRVCIYGASYGGYAAFENPIRYPNLYKCAFGYVGAYDLTLLGERGDTSHTAGGVNAWNVYLGTDEEERKRESPAYNADKLTIPVMIAYGGADVRVVPAHAKNMLSALDKAGKKYPEPIYHANEPHGFRDQDHNFDLYTQMLAFFDKYIGPDASKAPAPPAKGN